MYITAFELLKDSIISHPKTLFTNGFNSDGLIIDKNYQKKVLSRNKSPLYASLDWFKEMETITDHDIVIFNKLKEYRNTLSHELANSIFQGIDEDKYYELFTEMIDLFERIDKWWILNFELAINTDIDMDQIDEDSVQSGPAYMLKVMLNIVFADDEEEAWKYYNALINESK